MKTFTSIDQWRLFRKTLGPQNGPLGFVATMGALHPGHTSLVEASQKSNAITIVSVFVNSRQFDDQQDFENYPLEYAADLAVLEQAGVDVVLLPDSSQMYADDYRFRVSEKNFSQQLCGAHRPCHFDAVLTVVMRLLNLVQADNAYFGEKDYQQLQLIRDMAAAFFMPVNIVACPTMRESDGLAISSRNQGLDAGNRAKAAALYSVLRQSNSAQSAAEDLIRHGFKVDYVEDLPGRRLAAARIGNTRLIDNVPI
jgi:pantoate--beta-alanine ligase